MLDASLGYYINPLLNVLLGMLFLGERLRKLQWFAVALAAIGVGIQLVVFGSVPIVAIALPPALAFMVCCVKRSKSMRKQACSLKPVYAARRRHLPNLARRYTNQ